MNKIIRYLNAAFMVGFLLSTTSCDDFLDKGPLAEFTDENYWISESNVKSFAWMFYDDFLGYGNGTGTTADFYFQSSSATGALNFSDDLCNASFLNFQSTPSTTNSDWKGSYAKIRRANLMLRNIPTVPKMSAEAINHWSAVARFFRAYHYFLLVQRFGDVPYVSEYTTNTADANLIYLPRSPRNDVMDKVFEDLDFAAKNIRKSDGINTVNYYVVCAVQARAGLYEGTYRKYQQAASGAKYLELAKTASAAIMANTAFSLNATHQSVFNSIDLGSSKEMILYKSYLPSVWMHSIQAYTNTSSIINGLSRAAVESYACTDGLPIGQSANYQGDASIEQVRANRDLRLLSTIAPKYAYSGKDDGGLVASTGYRVVLYNNPGLSGTQVTTTGQNHIDAPLFTLSEVYLNYAEACAELNQITQADLDMSINKLRPRAGLPNLTLVGSDGVSVNGVEINDPERTNALEQKTGVVSPLLWEIRRERRAELLGWTTIRLNDLMRWKKGLYLDMTENPKVGQGAKVGEANKGKTTVNPDGYILPYGSNSRSFVAPKHYLNSIPTAEIALYAAEGVELTQNPGW